MWSEKHRDIKAKKGYDLELVRHLHVTLPVAYYRKPLKNTNDENVLRLKKVL